MFVHTVLMLLELHQYVVSQIEPDLKFLEMIEEEDKVFPEINILDWQK